MFSHIAKIVGIVDFQAKILINVGQLYKKMLKSTAINITSVE